MEPHGGGDDGEMMSSGNKGGGFVWDMFLFAMDGVFVLVFEYGSWCLFFHHLCSFFLCAR